MLEVMVVMAVSLLDNGQPSGREFNPGPVSIVSRADL